MEKKNSDQKDPYDNQKKDNHTDMRNENRNDTPDDSMFLQEEEAVQNEDEDELSFSKYENEDFVAELNQQNERMQEEDPLEFNDNPYLDDVDFDDPELDIPGSDLDNEMEDIGSEDEENNYYSLGGDRHEDLDEQHFDEDL